MIRKLIIEKLHAYEFGKWPLVIISSYLTYKKQRLKISSA